MHIISFETTFYWAMQIKNEQILLNSATAITELKKADNG